MTGTYEALKRAGHTPDKAAEIIADAKRGCDHARHWIAAAGAENGSYGSPEGVQSYAMQDADDFGDVHSEKLP